MLPLPRSRTSSFSSSFNPTLGPSSYDAHFRALSVPPLPSSSSSIFNIDDNRYGIGNSNIGGFGGTSFGSGISNLPPIPTGKIRACKPCKRLGKICRSGKRPCIACLTSGLKDQCIQGERENHQAETSRDLSPKRSPDKPIFDDQPMFPPSSDPPQLRNRFGYKFPIHMEQPLTYPPLGSLELLPNINSRSKTHSSSPGKGSINTVFMVLDFEFKIGRASRDCLILFGSHPHEMRGQHLAIYLPITERERWKGLTKLLLNQLKLPDKFLEIPPIELSRLTWDQLRAPVEGLKPVGRQFQIRRSTGETLPVQIVLWFGSCYGATASDPSSFKSAIILAKITPLNAISPSSVRIKPNLPSASLLGFDEEHLSGTGNDYGAGTLLPPPRRRNLSFTAGGNSLPPPLPPPSMLGGGRGLNSLPPLPPIGFTSNDLPPLPPIGSLGDLPPVPLHRRRKVSGSLPPLSSNLDLGVLPPPRTRTRSRTSSLLGSQGTSLASSASSLSTFPSSSYDKLLAMPSVPIDEFPDIPRPSSRRR